MKALVDRLNEQKLLDLTWEAAEDGIVLGLRPDNFIPIIMQATPDLRNSFNGYITRIPGLITYLEYHGWYFLDFFSVLDDELKFNEEQFLTEAKLLSSINYELPVIKEFMVHQIDYDLLALGVQEKLSFLIKFNKEPIIATSFKEGTPVMVTTPEGSKIFRSVFLFNQDEDGVIRCKNVKEEFTLDYFLDNVITYPAGVRLLNMPHSSEELETIGE